MIPLNSNPNVDNSDLANYPDGRIRDNDGTNNGTGVNRSVYGDLHSNISKLMRLYAISPSGLPDNETNGFQIIEALKALASKNDYIYPLATNGTDTLSIDIKLSLMNTGEFLTCLASANKTTETLIKGSGPTSYAVTYSGNFKTNEYVRVIKTVSGVTIVRVADWNSLNAMCNELLFLKKATQSEEDAGVIETVATTPLVNKTTFIKRVIGADSGSYLATAIRNGLYPKEHWAIVDGLGSSKTKNIAWVSGIDIGGTPGALATSGGGITAAMTVPSANESTITISGLPVAMNGTAYYVKLFPQSEGTVGFDDDIMREVFRPITSTSFSFTLNSTTNNTQSLKYYFETVNF
jgi:hypothetical protein